MPSSNTCKRTEEEGETPPPSLLPSVSWDQTEGDVSVKIDLSRLLQTRNSPDNEDDVVVSDTTAAVEISDDGKILYIKKNSPSSPLSSSFKLLLRGDVRRERDSLQVKKEGPGAIHVTLKKKSPGVWTDLSSTPIETAENEKKENSLGSPAADASCSSSPVVDESCFLAKERNVGSKTIAVPGSTRAHSRYHTKTANQYFASIHKEDIKKPRRPSAAPQPDATGPTPEKTAEEQEVLEAKEDEDRQNPSHSMLDAILEHLSEEDRRALDPSKVPELSKEHLGEAADFFKPRKNKKKDDDSAEEGLSLTAAQRMLTLIEMWNASSKEERLEFLKRLIQTTKEKLGGGGGGEEQAAENSGRSTGSSTGPAKKGRRSNCLVSVDELSNFVLSDEKKNKSDTNQKMAKEQGEEEEEEEEEGQDCLGEIDASSQYVSKGVTFCHRWISDLKKCASVEEKADCLQALINQLDPDEIEVILSTFV